MPFPYHDRAWVETARFLQQHVQSDELVIAPNDFVNELPTVHSYAVSFTPVGLDYPWIVVHKGMLDQVQREFLVEVKCASTPVFANDVFVVFTRHGRLTPVEAHSPHLKSLHEQVERLAGTAQVAPARATNNYRPRPDIATLTVEDVRREMNQRYANLENDEFGGYEHPHLWDKVRYAEVNRAFARMIAPTKGLTVLQVGCGLGRAVPWLSDCKAYLGTDLSDTAVERAREMRGVSDHLQFKQMDAMNLALPDDSFDLVVGLEMIEHVTHAEKVLSEAHRVLRPGGKFVVNSVNRDSLHLRMMRKLGYPEFRATIEHVREFSFSEMAHMLEHTGFRIFDSAGVFLLPYYGVPEIDRPVRALTDDDPEIVEIFRDLGERAGAAYGYEFVVSAVKPRS